MADDETDPALVEAFRKAREALGEEGLALLLSYPQEVRTKLLSEGQLRAKKRGGRPKGSRGINPARPLERMADLRLDNPRMSQREAAKVAARGEGITWEYLRKLYAESEETLLAAARKRREPPPAPPKARTLPQLPAGTTDARSVIEGLKAPYATLLDQYNLMTGAALDYERLARLYRLIGANICA